MNKSLNYLYVTSITQKAQGTFIYAFLKAAYGQSLSIQMDAHFNNIACLFAMVYHVQVNSSGNVGTMVLFYGTPVTKSEIRYNQCRETKAAFANICVCHTIDSVFVQHIISEITC